MAVSTTEKEARALFPRPHWTQIAFWAVLAILLAVMFYGSFTFWWSSIQRKDSYYSHAVLVPFVSLFFVWRKRSDLASLPRQGSNWGFVVLASACGMMLLGELWGFRIFGQAALIPLLAGLILIFLGWRALFCLWFPLAFLVFMIPLPTSLTTSVTFRIKMIAAEGAVQLAKVMCLPMVRDGSHIHFGNDYILIGDICGGLRSLIALLALGAIMSYISDANLPARLLLFVLSAPIAVISNIVRIFFLCVVAYFWGSESAEGWVHDVSGIFIYIIALSMLLGLDRLLRRAAPSRKSPAAEAPS